MRRGLLALLAAVVVVPGMLLLRAELMTVEVEQPEGSYTDVVVAAYVRGEDPGVREEMVRGLVSTCRLLVNADVVAESFRTVEPGVFAFRLRPGIDEFDRRELRGCLSDLRVQHLRADVRVLETATPADPERARAAA
ncbi:hypothetical protein [Geodermatophilus sp. DSM 44513]|uniref:hypothetical protein n=1 Tax=Geodermatophilus sp. DSM 44513 TaxID=1528104 RepID=UPI0012710590|nr:hypothetical protein [Geodermatophilus sp. DSM 44513]WNV77660.1 hypothetical protein RTG05_10400 [Geodermatophilus sp. DSM 44513]